MTPFNFGVLFWRFGSSVLKSHRYIRPLQKQSTQRTDTWELKSCMSRQRCAADTCLQTEEPVSSIWLRDFLPPLQLIRVSWRSSQPFPLQFPMREIPRFNSHALAAPGKRFNWPETSSGGKLSTCCPTHLSGIFCLWFLHRQFGGDEATHPYHQYVHSHRKLPESFQSLQQLK